ncbi:histidine kinase [Haloferax mediterranei ATCC 33500]|uniref:Histidine kinase n=1 Tax=Haloferax mediterranei (strain ATCC 33500 / DSM 1411 / JCM 8866 / NBRC 14739 / NCIMB 2177 / R-4) TaxID=523841 RepID=I3R6E2_HALMT|nr:hypothetical protein HFX_2111 [Haloferax mediterranei ATCC 33500]AHZ23187.1 histidine kinase [Haloferax mediterranei ATCC 33500]ELZ99765.1 hypothetical protein C439_12354 [Haloferax mediterranei ATCC 33500]QCQ73952.1 histidine kinase [Haloferax mediterranei ATCC 33500]
MSQISMVSTPRLLVYGPPPDQQPPQGVVEVQYVSSNQELSDQLTGQPAHLILCLHAPPQFNGVEAVKAVRRFDASVPVVLATQMQNARVNIQAIQSQVTWSVGLPSDVPAEEALSEVVVDAAEWLDGQTE